jgi:hypothetical protein
LGYAVSYGTDEHRNALGRLLKVAHELEMTREAVRSLRSDLFDDDIALTQEARDHLQRVSQMLGSCVADIDNAATDLPTPLPDSLRLWRAGGDD